jgi:hypothetical protein
LKLDAVELEDALDELTLADAELLEDMALDDEELATDKEAFDDDCDELAMELELATLLLLELELEDAVELEHLMLCQFPVKSP